MKMNTKSKLISSLLVLVLCVTAFFGSTYAWFTDSVTSSGNKIQAGTLDIGLSVLEKDGRWTDITNETTPIFNNDKWEPGYTETKIFRVVNNGNLALKWVASLTTEEELSVLADVIDVYVLPSENEISHPAGRDLAGYTRAGTLREFTRNIKTTTVGVLEENGDVAYLGFALKMPEEIGNEYNGQKVQGVSLGGEFDIKITAYQKDFESDSFNSKYDENAAPVYVGTKDELTDALNAGKAVIFEEDIALDAAETIDKAVDIDLNGYTLSTKGLDLKQGGSIENGTVKSAGHTNMVPHLKISGGDVVLDNVTVYIDDYLNYQAQGNRAYGEYTGMEVASAKAILNSCTIHVKNETYRTWNYVYGITMTNADLTINGGSITVESAGASSTDLETALSCIGNSTVTLNNVEVNAETYGTTMGHLVVNTTDDTVTDADFVSYGGTYELNIIN